MTLYKENEKFRILSAIGIILVVAGHLAYNLFDVGGLFPYYSFHVFIFLFVSGYFYKQEAEERVLHYILKKCRTLLLPYFAWNLIYGIFAAIMHGFGFTIGQKLSFYTLFLAPFDGGHQFMYHFPAWFVIPLFLVEVVNILIRKMLSLLHLNYEWLIFAGCLAVGIVTVYLAIGGHVWGLYQIPGRVLFMLPGFQLGRIYKEKIEKKDHLPNGIYFLLIITAQLLLTVCNAGLAFGAVWVSSFANGPIVPYLTVITGIAFWLRIAELIKDVSWLREKMIYIGRNTFSIMMHHMFAVFLVNSLLYLITRVVPIWQDFDETLYFSDVNYVYPIGGEAGKWIYLLAGIAIPLLIAKCQKKVIDSAKSVC